MQAGLSLSLSKRCVEQVPGSHQTHFKIPEEMRRLGANPENLDADWVQGVPARAGDCARGLRAFWGRLQSGLLVTL